MLIDFAYFDNRYQFLRPLPSAALWKYRLRTIFETFEMMIYAKFWSATLGYPISLGTCIPSLHLFRCEKIKIVCSSILLTLIINDFLRPLPSAALWKYRLRTIFETFEIVCQFFIFFLCNLLNLENPNQLNPKTPYHKFLFIHFFRAVIISYFYDCL